MHFVVNIISKKKGPVFQLNLLKKQIGIIDWDCSISHLLDK